MSNKESVLHAIKNDPGITVDGLIDATGLERKQITKAIFDAKDEGYIVEFKDVVTGVRAYTLTIKAEARLINRPQDKPVENINQPAAAKVKPAPAKMPEPHPLEAAHIDFCEWLHRTARTERMPINMHECKQVIEKMIENHCGREGIAAQKAEPIGYSIMFDCEARATPEEAMQSAADSLTSDDLARVRIVAVTPVARIELKPALVMDAT